MKLFSVLSSLLVATSLFAAEGSFYVNKQVVVGYVSQNGTFVNRTNVKPGSTLIMDENSIADIQTFEKTTIYLAGGPTIVADAGSHFSIDTFDEEINNLTNTPCLALFGAHNISMTLIKGNFLITYNGNASSTFAVSTPLALYQMNSGQFVFQVSDDKSLVYVLDGTMIVHGDKNRTDTAKKGHKSVTGRIDTEIATTTRPINPQENSTIAEQTKPTTESIVFVVIDKKVRGIRMSP